MTTTGGNPFDEGPDLEGCMENHCHARRSPRQEDSRTPEGRIKACHKPKGWGTSHVGTGTCKLHGGGTRQSQIKAEREKARREARTLGLPIDVDPSQALLQEVHRTAGHVVWLGRRIAEMEAGDLVWGVVEETAEPGVLSEDGEIVTSTTSTRFKAGPHAYYRMYQEERKHLAVVCKAALDAGVSERMLNVFEQVGETYIGLIERVLERLDLTEDQRAAVPAAVVSELQAITGEVA